jgi:hypothetical protein
MNISLVSDDSHDGKEQVNENTKDKNDLLDDFVLHIMANANVNTSQLSRKRCPRTLHGSGTTRRRSQGLCPGIYQYSQSL